jgi:Helix-turn-helix domain
MSASSDTAIDLDGMCLRGFGPAWLIPRTPLEGYPSSLKGRTVSLVMFDTTPWRNPLGRFLRAVREERKLSREALVSEIQRTTKHRLSANYYYRIERGFRTPSADVLDKIAHGLGLTEAGR